MASPTNQQQHPPVWLHIMQPPAPLACRTKLAKHYCYCSYYYHMPHCYHMPHPSLPYNVTSRPGSRCCATSDYMCVDMYAIYAEDNDRREV